MTAVPSDWFTERLISVYNIDSKNKMVVRMVMSGRRGGMPVDWSKVVADWGDVEVYKPPQSEEVSKAKLDKIRNKYSIGDLPIRHEERHCLWHESRWNSKEEHDWLTCPYWAWMRKQPREGKKE